MAYESAGISLVTVKMKFPVRLFCCLLALTLPQCLNLGKEAKISITNPTNIADLCVSINSDSKKEAKTVPYTYTASEGDTVTIYAYTSTASVATGSVTTRITNNCEDEVNYSAKVFSGYIALDDDFTAVPNCTKKSSDE
jgi:hypothetical protein